MILTQQVWAKGSAMEKQQIKTERLPSGDLEVTCEPLLKGSVEASWVDSSGTRHVGISTEEELRALGNVPDDYVTLSFRPNSWTQQDEDGPFVAHQAKGSFAPPRPQQRLMEDLLEEIKASSPIRPRNIPAQNERGERMLEISIVDPHFGLQCFRGQSDEDYDLAIAAYRYMGAVQRLVRAASIYGPFDKILFPFGNDYIHAEPMPSGKGEAYGTTSGVSQPEMVDWYETYRYGERTLRETLTYLSEIAPVEALVVMGNHDKNTTYTIGRVMNAYFHNDENVNVDCSPDPYKFVEWGCNLIGFEHGHNVAQVRLAALMANEAAQAWARTEGGYREWHLGDQHRKGSAKPSMLEEQGVSVEFLPSLVAPNTWHRAKSFNHQKRGAMAWVWDKEAGPIARLQVNINSLTGEFMDAA